MIGKLISLASIGGTVASVKMLQRFLSGLTGVIALTIVSALMAAVLLMGGFYGIYLGLTRYGLDQDAALLSVGVIVLAVTVVSSWMAINKLRHLRELPFTMAQDDLPSLSKLSHIASAFVEGFMSGGREQRR